MIDEVLKKGNPCIVGLDPRIDQMPAFAVQPNPKDKSEFAQAVSRSIALYHHCIIDAVADIVPAVKLQSAFYEQYGMGGMLALEDTVKYAKSRGLIVIIDGKRNDIAASAQAYANTFLGKTAAFGSDFSALDADCLTVSPYLGRDSIEPFVKACSEYGRGIFVLVKTSNPGSGDIQDLRLQDGSAIYGRVAGMVNGLAQGTIGEHGYSSIGAVVGATFPEQARAIRSLIPKSIFLVPGYGKQGGSGADVVPCFNKDGLGAVVNASRSITYDLGPKDMTEEKVSEEIRRRVQAMASDISIALAAAR